MLPLPVEELESWKNGDLFLFTCVIESTRLLSL